MYSVQVGKGNDQKCFNTKGICYQLVVADPADQPDKVRMGLVQTEHWRCNSRQGHNSTSCSEDGTVFILPN